MASRGVGGMAAVLIVGLIAAPLQAQGLTGLVGGVAGAQANGAAGNGAAMVTGRKQPLYPNSPEKGDAIEIEPGHAVAGDFADAPPVYGERYPVMVYRVHGQAGKAITAKVDSPDVHVWLWFSRDLTNAWTGPTMAPMPVAGGPKINFVTLNPQRTGPYYIMVIGVPTKENGKLSFGRYADSGRFTLAVTDVDHPEATPVGGTALAGSTAQPASAVTALAQNYAQLCGAAAAANSETCTALRRALAAQIAEAKNAAPAAGAIGGPLGIRVAEGAGGQVRADVVALDPRGPAAAAGLKVGDALLYAKGPGGARTFFGDQASLDAWAAGKPAGSTHEIAYSRKGSAAVQSATVRLVAPGAR